MSLKLLKKLYWKYIKGPEAYARYLGVNIGDDCFIATYNWSSEPYLITVGNHVQITSNVYLHTHGGAHVVRSVYPNFDVFGKIVIEDWSYIGAGSQIMPGVTIGAGSLIAAGSIVTKSVPPKEVWGGVPARRICSVDEYIKHNLPYNLNSKGMDYEEKRKFLLSLSDDKFIRK
ncbi:acyltransferase [Muribaculaceae bacterium Isolate-037 (Harlan)]|jgi:acetyltransferase-like isoleucine patch superfamily enzyme|nr:acyltransferase [Muribaculaceae bacterium Isolate-037 (Harlan)]